MNNDELKDFLIMQRAIHMQGVLCIDEKLKALAIFGNQKQSKKLSAEQIAKSLAKKNRHIQFITKQS